MLKKKHSIFENVDVYFDFQLWNNFKIGLNILRPTEYYKCYILLKLFVDKCLYF